MHANYYQFKNTLQSKSYNLISMKIILKEKHFHAKCKISILILKLKI